MPFHTPEERQSARLLLQMASLAATIGGNSFDDDLQALIDRAINGDEEIDLEALLERVNAQLPNASSSDPSTWTFNDGLRASCKYFSIAIPDGFRVLNDYEEGLLSTVRPFVAVPNEIEDRDVPNADRLVCGAMPMPPLEDLDEYGIDEIAVTTIRSSMNTNIFGSSKVPEDWVVQGKNCSVVIMRMDNGCTGYEYWIRPAIPQLGHYVRCIFSNSDAAQAETAKDTLTAMAKSIEVTHPIESELTRQLDRISTQRVKPAEFNAAVENLHSALIACRDRNHEANRAQYLTNAEHPNNYDLTKACVLGLETFYKRVWPLYKKLDQAILFQQDKGASELELAAESNVLADSYALFLVNYLADSKGSAQYLREHGPVHRPSGYPQRLSSSARFCKGKYHELYELLVDNEKKLERSIRQHIDDPDESLEPEPEDEPEDVREFVTSPADLECTPSNGQAAPTHDEPFGVDYPALVMTLLSDDWIFFEDDEIAWDGHHHTATGAQLNGAKVNGLLDFVNSCIPGFDDVTEVFQYFISFLNEVEKDEGLIVPRNMIAPGVQQAIRDGDLTGLTLANLAACARAFSVEKIKPGTYRVIFDERLLAGIPMFLDLVARLVWDLRQGTISLRGKPFEIGFLQARNIDADHYLGSVETPVPGAQEYSMFMKVTEAPRIALPDANEAVEYQKQVSVELSPEDDMALDFVYALVRDFPCTKPISGTHFLDRAARIEHIEAGDRLVLAADWNCEFFDPAGIEVFNEQGETLGYLEGVVGPMRGALALILPHVTATVESVTPLSKRKKGSKYALMDVHMELDDDATVEGILNVDPSNELLAQARSLLIRPKSERTVMSHANIGISQLKGRIDVSNSAYGDTTGPAGDNDPIIRLDRKSDTADASSTNGSCITPKMGPEVRSHYELSLANDSQAEQKVRERAEHEQAERKRAEQEAHAKAERERAERERAEQEQAKQERLQAEEKARIEHAAHISNIKSRVDMHRAAIAKARLDIEIKRRALNSMRKDDSIPRPRLRATQYQAYTLELMIDHETTELNRLLLGLSKADAHEAEVDAYVQDAVEGPLLPTAAQAIERHRVFCTRIAEGKNGDKCEPFNDPLYGRILEHLIETGGGLGPGTIRHDAETTKNILWTPASQQADLNIDEALAFLDDPVHEMTKRYKRINPKLGTDPDNPAFRKYKGQACINMEDGLAYLWFQRTPDTVSQLHYRRMLMEEAQQAAAESKAIQRKITAYEELITSLGEELEALGMLDFSRRSAIKQRVSECEEELGQLQNEYDRLHPIALDLDHRIEVYRKSREEFYVKASVEAFELSHHPSRSVEG